LPRGRSGRSGWSESDVWTIAPAAQGQSDDTAFREGQRDLGYVEGKNLQIEYYTAAGDESRVPVLAKELAVTQIEQLA